jgi:2-dehydro-3-deoxyphosphooctonate aldolase (KDO 8-P synthase)
MKKIKIKDFYIGKGEKLCVISGPCVIENKEHAIKSAKALKEIFKNFDINFIFKASYDKANRSSINSFRGPGINKGLKILKEIKETLNIPILTDIHHPEEAFKAAEVSDIIQIPAFLSRQTDLLTAAAKTKAAINVKKGQFMSPHDMKNAVEKILFFNNKKIILTDRGTSFGYNNLISDMRAIPIMQTFGFPVCFDASHSTQKPSSLGSFSGGAKEFIPTLAKSAVAAGCNLLYIESHSDPSKAKCDSKTVMPFDDLKKLLYDVEKLYKTILEINA